MKASSRTRQDPRRAYQAIHLARLEEVVGCLLRVTETVDPYPMVSTILGAASEDIADAQRAIAHAATEAWSVADLQSDVRSLAAGRVPVTALQTANAGALCRYVEPSPYKVQHRLKVSTRAIKPLARFVVMARAGIVELGELESIRVALTEVQKQVAALES